MASIYAEIVPSPLGKDFVIRSRSKIQLGPCTVDLRSNEPNYKGLRHFSKFIQPDEAIQADYTVSLCSLTTDGPWPLAQIRRTRNVSYRAKRFSAGYYITDHFGPPAYLLTSGSHYWIFAVDFEPILWPYLVKILLTRYSIANGLLHLKAAAVAVNGAGTLLVGHGGGGKTVLLTRLCSSGAEFFSNTHTLIDGNRMIGIPAAMRVRNDELFASIIATRKLSTGFKAGEYIADPQRDLGWTLGSVATVSNICLVDYRGPDQSCIGELSHRVLFDYMSQFSLALNVYGLKEDVLDLAGGDVQRFSSVVGAMHEQLHTLVHACRTFYISCDILRADNLDRVLDLLAGC